MLTTEVKTLTSDDGKFPDMETPDLAYIARSARVRAELSPNAAAAAIGCSRPLVLAWEKGDNTIAGSKYLLSAARAYHVRPEWLASGLGDDGFPWSDGAPTTTPDKSQPVARFETAEGYVRFPLLEGFAGMGRGDYVGDYPEIVEFVEVTREWAAAKLRNVPHDAIRVITGRGQSMRGMYDDGDLIFIDSRIKQFQDDAAYVFRLGGRVQVKRLQWRGDKLRILSANPAYEPMDVSETDLEIGGMALAAWTLKEF